MKKNRVLFQGGQFTLREAGSLFDKQGQKIEFEKALVIQQGNKSLALTGASVRALAELLNSPDPDIQHFLDTL
jgi:hypothetical protein